MPNYGDKKYWEQRYLDQINTTFDWYLIIIIEVRRLFDIKTNNRRV